MINIDNDIHDEVDLLMVERYPEVVQEEARTWNAMMSAKLNGTDEVLAHQKWSEASRNYRAYADAIRVEVEKRFA